MSANAEQILSVDDLNARPKELDAAAASEIAGGAKLPTMPNQLPNGTKVGPGAATPENIAKIKEKNPGFQMPTPPGPGNKKPGWNP